MKKTKHALLLSAVSMLLCLSMLIGSTFAWFTDTASTGVNKIVAGNLDVELYYWTGDANAADLTVEANWADAEKADPKDIFDETKWEPGHAQVVYFKVVNAGSLDLKFKMGTEITGKTVGKTADDKDIDLTKFIKFGIHEDVTKAYTDRAAAIADADANAEILGTYANEILELKDGESKIVALVAYMPTTVGNEANHGKDKAEPSVEFKVKVEAAQLVSEDDSFGNDYDLGAKLPESATAQLDFDADNKVANDVILAGSKINAVISKGTELKIEGETDPINEETEVKIVVENSEYTPNITVNVGDTVETYDISLVAITDEGEKEVSSDQPITV